MKPSLEESEHATGHVYRFAARHQRRRPQQAANARTAFVVRRPRLGKRAKLHSERKPGIPGRRPSGES